LVRFGTEPEEMLQALVQAAGFVPPAELKNI
jgi:hypothetical protein